MTYVSWSYVSSRNETQEEYGALELRLESSGRTTRLPLRRLTNFLSPLQFIGQLQARVFLHDVPTQGVDGREVPNARSAEMTSGPCTHI